MKRKILAVLLILTMALPMTACGKSAEYAEYIEELLAEESDLMELDEDDGWWQCIAENKDSSAFEKEVNKAFAAVKDREDLNEQFEGGVLTRLAQTAVFLERAGYTKESTKQVLQEAIQFHVEKEMKYGVGRIIYCLQYFDEGSYYGTTLDYLSKETIKEYVDQNYVTPAFEATDLSGFGELFTEVEEILSYLDYVEASDLLDYEAIKAHISSQFPTVCIRNGEGGYYDEIHEQFSATSSVDDLYYTHRSSSSFFGDFRVASSSKTAYRPTGEDWEDDLLSKYDSESVTTYYKETELGGNGEWLRTYSADLDATAYITVKEHGDYDVIIFGPDYIATYYAHIDF